MIRSSDCPTASAEAKPKIRSGPGFQKLIRPSWSVAMIASDADASSALPRSREPLMAMMWRGASGFSSGTRGDLSGFVFASLAQLPDDAAQNALGEEDDEYHQQHAIDEVVPADRARAETDPQDLGEQDGDDGAD